MTPISADAVGQLRRLLALLPRFADRGAVPIAAVAAELACSEEQVRRDLRALDDHEDRGGFIEKFHLTLSETELSVEARTFRRPMRLARDEVRALELGLSLLRNERVEPAHAAIDAALVKVRRQLAVPGTVAGGVAGTHGAVDPALLSLVQEAKRSRRMLRLVYAPGGGPPSTRQVHVYATYFASGMWYAVVFNPANGMRRAYRLDRMSDATLEETRFEVPSDFRPEDWSDAHGRVFRAAEAPSMRVRYSSVVARWIAERERVSLAPDGTLEIEHPLADEAWAVRHLLQYGTEVQVLDPPSLREALVRALDRLLDAPA